MHVPIHAIELRSESLQNIPECSICRNMFIRLEEQEIDNFIPDWCIYCAPGFHADPLVDGTRQHNFFNYRF